MNEKLIKKQYLKKISDLRKHNQAYYDKSAPLIADTDYDKLKKDIVNYEKKYKFLKNQNSPSLLVGFRPSKNFKKIKHKVPMLSLSNAFDEEDLINFEKRITNYLNKNINSNIEYSAEPKIDGISASLYYRDGKFIAGLSRGDGKEGEDITENLKTIKDIPKNILKKNFPKEIDIRGEVFIKNSDFKKLSDKFANPRNAASDSSMTIFLAFIKSSKIDTIGNIIFTLLFSFEVSIEIICSLKSASSSSEYLIPLTPKKGFSSFGNFK